MPGKSVTLGELRARMRAGQSAGATPAFSEEIDARLRRLMGFGLQGVEGFYSGFTDKLRAQVLALAAKYGLYVTAGSDYHGKNKLVRLGDTGLDEVTEYPEGLTKFLEEVGVRG